MTVTKQYEDREPPQIVSGRRVSQVNPFNDNSDEAQAETEMSEPRADEMFSIETITRNQNSHGGNP